jgi:Flp pilus assembly protein TadG
MRKVLNMLSRLRQDTRAATIIELALAAPILTALLFGMVDIGRGFSMKLQLEQAAQRAIEKVMNGQADRSSASALKAEAATTAGVPQTNVTVDFWLECDGTRQSSYDSTCNTGQTYRRYLTVQISKSFSPMFAVRRLGANSDGTYTVIGKTGVRTQ